MHSIEEMKELSGIEVVVVLQSKGLVKRGQQFLAFGVGLLFAAGIDIVAVASVAFLHDRFDDVMDLAVFDEAVRGFVQIKPLKDRKGSQPTLLSFFFQIYLSRLFELSQGATYFDRLSYSLVTVDSSLSPHGDILQGLDEAPAGIGRDELEGSLCIVFWHIFEFVSISRKKIIGEAFHIVLIGSMHILFMSFPVWMS